MRLVFTCGVLFALVTSCAVRDQEGSGEVSAGSGQSSGGGQDGGAGGQAGGQNAGGQNVGGASACISCPSYMASCATGTCTDFSQVCGAEDGCAEGTACSAATALKACVCNLNACGVECSRTCGAAGSDSLDCDVCQTSLCSLEYTSCYD